MGKIVLDSSVVNKLFSNESDREKALAPSLLVYEVFNVLIRFEVSTEKGDRYFLKTSISFLLLKEHK